jgi:hypothetical protein
MLLEKRADEKSGGIIRACPPNSQTAIYMGGWSGFMKKPDYSG